MKTTSIDAPSVGSMVGTKWVMVSTLRLFDGGVMTTRTGRVDGSLGLAKKPRASVFTGALSRPTTMEAPTTAAPLSSRTKPRTEPKSARAHTSMLAFTCSSTIAPSLSSLGHFSSSTSTVKLYVPVCT